MKHLRIPIICLSILYLCLAFSRIAAASEELTGGIITQIPRQRFLTNLPSTEFEAGTDPEQLEELVSLLDSYTIIVTCGEETYELPMELSWNRSEVDFNTPGTYQFTGTILPPKGCTFADGVLQQIVMPVVIKEAAPNEIRTLDILHNNGALLAGRMLETGDQKTWNQLIEDWISFIPTLGAENKYGDYARLEPELFDTDNVQINLPGEYTVTIKLRLPKEYDGIFTLSPDIELVHIPIKITSPDKFEIWTSYATKDIFSVSFLPREGKVLPVYYTHSSHSLTSEELALASWKLYDSISGSQGLYRITRSLILDEYYYFYLKDGDTCSNTLCLVDNGNGSYLSFPITGDRDGGDASENTLPPKTEETRPSDPDHETSQNPDASTSTVSEPGTNSDSEPDIDSDSISEPDMKSDPEPDSSQPANANSDSNSDTTADSNHDSDSDLQISALPAKSFSDNTETITGRTLLLMLEKGKGKARISNQGITVTLQQESLSSYEVKENDIIKVSIEFLSKNKFILYITVNGINVQELKNTQIMVPYEALGKDSELYLLGTNQKEIPADSYDSKLGVASFTVDFCGTYIIQEKGNTPVNTDETEASVSKASEQTPSVSSVQQLNKTSDKLSKENLITIIVTGAVLFIIYIFTVKKGG